MCDAKLQISSESLQKLKCTQCKKYLSIFPIRSRLNGDVICGRCPSESNTYHNKIFEDLAEIFKFPCINYPNGCLENLLPKNMFQHENYCPYRMYECPTKNYTQCQWNGLCHEMYEHFEDKHPTFILNIEKFELDFINKYRETYIMPFEGDLYLVDRIMDTDNKLFKCNVTPIHINSLNVFQINYKLIFQNMHKTQEPVIIEKNVSKEIQVNTENLQKTLNDPTTIIVEIKVDTSNGLKRDEMNDKEKYQKTLDNAILKELECTICMEYMVPPIMLCQGGHSICSGCFERCLEQNIKCSYCQQDFTKNQNFALQNLVSTLDYPCKYEQCTFSSKATDIKAHELHCIYGTFKCPLNDYVECYFQSHLADMYTHILQRHHENLLEIESVTIPFDPTKRDEDCFIIKYFAQLFKLHYLYNNDDELFYWTLQVIGPPNISKKFKYSIDVHDNSGNNLRIYVKGQCTSLLAKSATFSETNCCIILGLLQIKALITDVLSYSIKILPDDAQN